MSRARLVALIGLVTLLLLEAAARGVFALRGPVQAILADSRTPILLTDDPLKVPDQRHPGNWKLRPGFSQTLQDVIDRSPDESMARYYREYGSRLGIPPGETIYRINRHGFKGPEVDEDHSRFRILTIGDSVTFGSFFDAYSYPRVVERILLAEGRAVEVINAGIPGYSPANVLKIIDELEALRPELVTVLIGWNALYLEDFVFGLARYSAVARLWIKASRRWSLRASPGRFMGSYGRPTDLDPRSRAVAAALRYQPSAIHDVERIVLRMQEVGARVVVMTLPGLFIAGEAPSARALQIGHLPHYTNNPHVVAAIGERYNIALQELAGQHGVAVIDLARWTRTAFTPRDLYFADTVHLNVEGQVLAGRHIVRELSRLGLLP